MTEQQQDVQAQQQPPQPPSAPLMTYAQVKQLRQMSLQLLHQAYTNFIKSIAWMNGDEKSLDEGMSLIDAGFLSLQKALLLAPIASLPKFQINPVPQPEAPTQQEKAQNEEAKKEDKPEEKVNDDLLPAA